MMIDQRYSILLYSSIVQTMVELFPLLIVVLVFFMLEGFYEFYPANQQGRLRTDLKPLEISQPEDSSFTVCGHEAHWQKWRFRIGLTPREGLVLYT